MSLQHISVAVINNNTLEFRKTIIMRRIIDDVCVLIISTKRRFNERGTRGELWFSREHHDNLYVHNACFCTILYPFARTFADSIPRQCPPVNDARAESVGT